MKINKEIQLKHMKSGLSMKNLRKRITTIHRDMLKQKEREKTKNDSKD